MAYVKQTWTPGETVTSAKLNHMEDGIASGGAMTVTLTYDEDTETAISNKTWQEIYDAASNGIAVIALFINSNNYVFHYHLKFLRYFEDLENPYIAKFYGDMGDLDLQCSSANSYPSAPFD